MSLRELGETFIIAVCVFWLSALYLILKRGTLSQRSDTMFIRVAFLPLMFVTLIFVLIIHGMFR